MCQPKPEVTWYKNGQAIDSGGTVSSYEFFENQYIHLLHLSWTHPLRSSVCRTHRSLLIQEAAETWLASEKQGYVKITAETTQTGILVRKKKVRPPGTCLSTDSSPDKFNHLSSLQIVASSDSGASNSENPQYVKETRQRTEPYNSNNTQENFFNSNNTIEKQDVSQLRTEHATVPGLIGDGLGYEESNESVTPSHQTPKVQKYISFSLPLPETTLSSYPGDSNSANMQPGPQVSSEDSDSDYELCPEITLTYAEEFSDDDLEYLECSDVMTDYSNAVWQRTLQGTDRVFLLESDDEEMEFNECGRSGCEHFFSEMGCGPQVSGGIWSLNVATDFCNSHSQPQEEGVRSSGTSRHSPLPLHSEMTLTLGPHQDGTAKMTEPGRAPLPTASVAVENDCSGIRGRNQRQH
ncbi:Alpha-protein kinase 2 [Apodemus speciosus]|uniref:Alpha-protein kinase 2 n=1 Tax=Apodemus speciosus TaxID=105296 RepID=A0ABQ0FRE2_APOSI